MEADAAAPNDLDWSCKFSTDFLRTRTKTSNIADFCKQQHLRYIVHITRFGNDSFQKQILLAMDQKRHARDRWLEFEKELNITKSQTQKIMQ